MSVTKRLLLWFAARAGRLAFLPLESDLGGACVRFVYPSSVPVTRVHSVLTDLDGAPLAVGRWAQKLLDREPSPYDGKPCAVYLLPHWARRMDASGGWRRVDGEMRLVEIAMIDPKAGRSFPNPPRAIP